MSWPYTGLSCRTGSPATKKEGFRMKIYYSKHNVPKFRLGKKKCHAHEGCISLTKYLTRFFF